MSIFNSFLKKYQSVEIVFPSANLVYRQLSGIFSGLQLRNKKVEDYDFEVECDNITIVRQQKQNRICK